MLQLIRNVGKILIRFMESQTSALLQIKKFVLIYSQRPNINLSFIIWLPLPQQETVQCTARDHSWQGHEEQQSIFLKIF